MDELKEQYMTTQFIVVRYGDEQFGIDIKYVDNIVRMQRITRVPKVQSYIKGVINLRGEIIPVISLRRQYRCFSGCGRRSGNTGAVPDREGCL